MRLVRRIHPHSAAVLRSAVGPLGSAGSLGVSAAPARRERGGKVLLLKRPLFVALAAAAALYLVHRSASGAWLRLFGALLLGAGAPLLHATFRSPNLKARLASAQQEFRAVWRGIQAGGGAGAGAGVDAYGGGAYGGAYGSMPSSAAAAAAAGISAAHDYTL